MRKKVNLGCLGRQFTEPTSVPPTEPHVGPLIAPASAHANDLAGDDQRGHRREANDHETQNQPDESPLRPGDFASRSNGEAEPQLSRISSSITKQIVAKISEVHRRLSIASIPGAWR